MRKPFIIENLEKRQHLAADFATAISFQPIDARRPPNMQIDYGASFGVRRGGMSFGWSDDCTDATVKRGVTTPVRNDTFIQMHGCTWEIAVPNGQYTVFLVAGDPARTGTRVGIDVEGSIAIAAVTKARKPYLEGSVSVAVTDGRLTIRSLAPASDILNYLAISGTYDTTPVNPPVNPPPVEPPPVEPEVQPLGTLSWAAKASLGVPRVEGMSTAINGKLYVFGGYLDNTWAPAARVDAYDPVTNKWTRMNDMPERISHCGTTNDGRFVYFVGGYQGLTGNKQSFACTTVRRYDPINDTWTTMKSLPAARGGGELFHVDGKLYYVGGSGTQREDYNTMFMLDLANPNAGWTTKAPLPEARNHFGGAVVNGKIYVVGGQTGQEEWVSFKNDVFCYDPATNTWTSKAPLPNPSRSHQTASTFAYQGWIITIGGETDGTVPGKPLALRNVTAYNPITNTWKSLTQLPAPRSTGFANVIGDTIVYSAGYNGANFYTTTWVGTFAV